MARAVTRDDQAFFETKAFKKTLYMYLQSEDELGASPPTSEHQKEKEKKGGDDDNYGPDDGNSEPAHHDLILSWEKPEEESAQSVVEVSVHWAGICPDPKLDSKLKEIAKAKETKAQKKKVRNQKRRAGLQKKFDALTKKNDDVGAAAVKKQMDKLDGQGDDESEDGGAAVDLNECIPITRMQTPAEFEQKSARSKALADALFAAEDAAADALFGITGFKKALEETGCLKTKTTKKKMTTDKSVQDVLKMGAHLLKWDMSNERNTPRVEQWNSFDSEARAVGGWHCVSVSALPRTHAVHHHFQVSPHPQLIFSGCPQVQAIH